jgi:hypothetical protein
VIYGASSNGGVGALMRGHQRCMRGVSALHMCASSEAALAWRGAPLCCFWPP